MLNNWQMSWNTTFKPGPIGVVVTFGTQKVLHRVSFSFFVLISTTTGHLMLLLPTKTES